ncbi:glycosyltransferase [Thiohalobacter sp. IOR34]|uniref:glycosyltransferase n=1 Tax=Thiohalobacter sp. IOR34 TaxID=3057176 RepID=UPI0025AF0A9B|nr:glycosyltransferase [Thiohalobacter sp. IOR34]WJW75301.1 glycosyltransferase [Thiohalobacter sp. IOR34]
MKAGMAVSTKRAKVLVTGPSLQDPGGVAGFFNALLPHFHADKLHDVEYLEIGSTNAFLRGAHPLVDQLRFRRMLGRVNPDIVHINPSLGFKSIVRDGLFLLAAKRRGVPVLVFFHGWNSGLADAISEKWAWLFRGIYGSASRIFVLGNV